MSLIVVSGVRSSYKMRCVRYAESTSIYTHIVVIVDLNHRSVCTGTREKCMMRQ